MVAGQISTALSKIGFEGQKRVAWVRRPEQYRWLGLAGESHVLYECFDEYTLDISTGQPIPQMEKDEMYLLSKATMVFTTSDPLYQRKRHMHPKVYLTPNGTDFDFFCQAWKDALSLPPELSRIRRPIIGYAGHLGQFIDLGLLTYLAERRPEWSFVLLGSIDPGLPMKEVETLGRKPNVYLLGEKPYGLMPSYSRGFDASILPLLANEYLDCSNPLTLWEQLSAGRVVVATDLEEIHKLGNFVLLARSKEEFLSCIERALTGNNQERIDKGIAAAKEHSWDVLTRRALDIMLYELDNAR